MAKPLSLINTRAVIESINKFCNLTTSLDKLVSLILISSVLISFCWWLFFLILYLQISSTVLCLVTPVSWFLCVVFGNSSFMVSLCCDWWLKFHGFSVLCLVTQVSWFLNVVFGDSSFMVSLCCDWWVKFHGFSVLCLVTQVSWFLCVVFGDSSFMVSHNMKPLLFLAHYLEGVHWYYSVS